MDENYEKSLEQAEYERLKAQYSALPTKKMELADGLMRQAARLRIYLDRLWADLSANGTTELFTQSEKTDPYERERPAARLFVSADKKLSKHYKTASRYAAGSASGCARSTCRI